MEMPGLIRRYMYLIPHQGDRQSCCHCCIVWNRTVWSRVRIIAPIRTGGEGGANVGLSTASSSYARWGKPGSRDPDSSVGSEKSKLDAGKLGRVNLSGVPCSCRRRFDDSLSMVPCQRTPRLGSPSDRDSQ